MFNPQTQSELLKELFEAHLEPVTKAILLQEKDLVPLSVLTDEEQALELKLFDQLLARPLPCEEFNYRGSRYIAMYTQNGNLYAYPPEQQHQVFEFTPNQQLAIELLP